MASSPGNPNNPQTPPYDLANFISNAFPAPPASYPPPTASYQFYAPPVNQDTPPSTLHSQRSLSYPTPPLNHNPGTQILALLNNNNTADPSIQLLPTNSGPLRVPSSKLPRGRRLLGEHAVYDVDKRFHGEIQPQLEVTPITKYGSDPQLVVGRQIAVNKVYICYGLKGGNIRVLNINTALRSLFRGHSQRVTDMAFFAQDVHMLASVSLDGKVFVWKISEGSEGDDQPQITGKIVLALQLLGEEDTKHPRVCWHCHKQEILVVSIGRHVVLIDTTKVGRGEVFSAEAPLQCSLDKPVDGVQIVGTHDGEVTDLSMCQWMTTRLVSSSVDGTVKIWQDRKAQPAAVLRPYDGQPVNSATFLTSPERPDHIILITGGPLNREMKIWVSAGEEGWLLPADAESWRCTQTLDLQSSSEPRAEVAFFNQVIALPEAGLLLLANAKRNAIYAVHLEYGSSPVETRMDYLSEFTVTMPILSFIGTNDPPEEPVVKVYCVQTLAIQQYTLDLCLCLPPPPVENMGLEKSDSSVSREVNLSEGMIEPSGIMPTELPSADSVPKPSILMNRSDSANVLNSSASVETASLAIAPPHNEPPRNPGLLSENSGAGSAYSPSPQLPPSPRLSGYNTTVDAIEPVLPYHDLGSKAPSVDNFNVSSIEESSRSKDKNVVAPDEDGSGMLSPPTFFKHPTHLVTPSEILMGVSSTEAIITSESSIQDVNNDVRGTEVEVREVGEARSTQVNEINSHEETENHTSENREKIFCSQASNLSTDMARDCYSSEESKEDSRGVSAKLPESVSSSAAASSKGKKQKAKNSQGPGSSSTSLNVANLADTDNEQSQSHTTDFLAIQEALNQVIVSNKETQRQIVKEGKRLEAALGRMNERSSKANADALWARLQEEMVKSEKASRENAQQIANVTSNLMMFEKTIKKELAAIAPALARAVTPVFEKTVSSAITESFQRGFGDKAVNQLDKSISTKLEATIARQIQAQFQTTGKQALQETVRSSLESSIIPSFERSCKTMFDQVDSAFQKGMAEHTNEAQQRLESGHSQLSHTLREAITSTSSVAQVLSRELNESRRSMLALAAAGGNPGGANPLVTQLSSGGPLSALLEKVEAPMDPTAELSRLISEHKYEESFSSALQRSDVSIVSWLCTQVDLRGLLALNPLPLSQGVLLSLLQQLACDISKDTDRKLAWMTGVVAAINPSDQIIAVHARPIFEQVYQILNHQRNQPGSDVAGIRVIMHVINSMLMSCK